MATATEHKAGLKPRSPRPTRVGVVVSDRCDKTICVLFRYSVKHPKYGKYIRRTTRLQAHDESNLAKVDDLVEVVQCRPISKMKYWRLLRIIEAAPPQPGPSSPARNQDQGARAL